jgi:hypothetical protein
MRILLLTGLLLLSGCGIFDTRDAEQPNQPRSNFVPPVRPEDVITNLQNALKDMNVENYISCFSDSSFADRQFRFAPSSTALSQFPIMAAGWGKREEQQYFLNLKNRISEDRQATLTLGESLFGSPQGDSIIFTASYSLNVPHDDPDIPKIFEGDMSLGMLRDSRSFWVIYFWRDSKTNDFRTWSELKGRFY